MLINAGDRVVMRKPHPCGGKEWEITRTGADVGLKCLKCGHKIMLERDKFERAVKGNNSEVDQQTPDNTPPVRPE